MKISRFWKWASPYILFQGISTSYNGFQKYLIASCDGSIYKKEEIRLGNLLCITIPAAVPDVIVPLSFCLLVVSFTGLQLNELCMICTDNTVNVQSFVLAIFRGLNFCGD